MADASNLQTDFRGGEWSPAAQGRMDDKEYPRGLNVCLNAFPTEEGPWTRRSGTRWMAPTLNGQYAWLIPFHFAGNAPYVMELTDSNIRFYSGPQLAITADTQQVVSASAANPTVITTFAAHGWNTGDVVQFLFQPTGADNTTAGVVAGQQFAITKLSNTTFSLADPVTGTTLDGSTFTIPAGTSIGRVLVVAAPYTQTQLSAVRHVQAEILANNVLQGQVVLLHNSVAPQVVVNSTPENGGAFAQFTLNPITFKDGPYFDPPTDGTTITPSGLSGSITLTASTAKFASTDVGRSVRLFSEPVAWAVGTAYVTGNVVKYTDGAYYTALSASTGKAPNVYPTLWSITPTAAVWAWGTITAFTDSQHVTITVDAGQALLYTTAVKTWRLGLYSATTGYPSCGVFHEGRLWLAGAQGNRFDASNSNDPFNFAPTAADGTVGDANGISYIFNSDDTNPIVWMTPGHNGIICGTLGGEWLVAASQLSDPLTPTSIQAHRASVYKCAAVLPVSTGFSTLFVQANGHRLIEYVADVFSQKFLGRNLSERGRHLSASGIAQLAYQRDLTPTVWVLMNDGSFAGLLYKRESSFTSEPPAFMGWHRHTLGSGCIVESIAAGPNATGALDTVVLSVVDPATGKRHVEMMSDMFDQTNTIDQAWFVDGGMAPSAVIQDTTVTPNTVKLTGFYPYTGKTLSVWLAGVDAGDFVVAADGSITVPVTGLLTPALLASYAGKSTTAWDAAAVVKTTVTNPGFSIQSYINTSIVSGGANGFCIGFDIARDRIVTASIAGTNSQNGINVFQASTGAFLGGITIASLFAAATRIRNYTPSNIGINSPLAIDAKGYVYFQTSGSNQTQLVKVDISDPTHIFIQDLFGTAASGFVSTATKMPLWSSACPVQAGDQTYLVFAGTVAATGVSVIQTNSAAKTGYPGYMINCNATGAGNVAGAFLPVEDGVYVCSGPEVQNGKSSSGSAYILGHKNNGAASTANLNLYHMSLVQQNKSSRLPAPVFTTIGTGIAPSAIDPAWTHFTTVRGPVYDKTDGNVIIWCQTSDAVTHQSYVVKISTSTGGVIWATALTNGDVPNSVPSLTCVNIQNGMLQWIVNGGSRLYTCTTSTGALAQSTVTGVAAGSEQFSDDRDNSLYLFGSYTSGGGAPTGLNGTTSYASQWGRLQGTGAIPSTTSMLFNMPRIPAVAGFTYTSQGQRLRPVSESGARNGPGFAKTRRNHKAGFQLANAQGLSIGTQFVDLTKMRVLTLKSDNVNVNAANQLFTGIARQPVDDPDSYDGMLAWQITRPYPCTVTAIGGFLHTQDI